MLRLIFRPIALLRAGRPVSYKMDANTSRRSERLEEWKPEYQTYGGYNDLKSPLPPQWAGSLVWGLAFGAPVFAILVHFFYIVPTSERRPRLYASDEDVQKYYEKHKNRAMKRGEKWDIPTDTR